MTERIPLDGIMTFILNKIKIQFLLILSKMPKILKKKGGDENHRCEWGCVRCGVWGVGVVWGGC